MSNTIKKSLLAVLSFLLVLACGVGIMTYNPAQASASPVISTVEAAEANVTTEDNSGLRFTANVNGAAYRALLGEYGEDKVDAGMLIVPTNIVTAAAEEGKEFTFAGMKQVEALNGFTYHGITESFRVNGDDYQFSVTVADIAEKNYARDYSARAFVKVAVSELVALDGVDNTAFVQDGDAFYAYAEFDANNARNVFEVACASVAGGDLGDSAPIAKKFMDKIVDLKYDQATSSVVIANNNANYTSPFVVDKDGFGNFVVNGKGVNPIAMFYNGERKTEYTFTDAVNVATVNTVLTQNATYDVNGVVSLPSVAVDNNRSGSYKIVSNNYVALDGYYGLGTYIDIYYTGDNAPYICYFADVINGCMNYIDSEDNDYAGLFFHYGQKQYVNGVADANNVNFSGPHRYDIEKKSTAPGTSVTKGYGGFKELNHAQAIADRQYKLTYGLVENNGMIHADITLSYLNGTTWTTLKTTSGTTAFTSSTTVSVEAMKLALGLGETDELKGKIILYAGIRGEGVNTTFSYSMPYTKNA